MFITARDATESPGLPKFMRVRDAVVLAAVLMAAGIGMTFLLARTVPDRIDTATVDVSSLRSADQVRVAIEDALRERRDIQALVDAKDAEIEMLTERYNELAASSGGDTSPEEPPADDPSLARQDEAGRSPRQAVLALIDAGNRADWRGMYSLYATPDVDLETMSSEYAQAGERYDDFRVLEERVTGPDSAFVRVTYTNRRIGEDRPVVVAEPGEWWPLHKVDGLWKTQWLPRQ